MAKTAHSIKSPTEHDWRAENYEAERRRHHRERDAWIEGLAEGFQSEHKGDLVGETIRFPVADGYATYMVSCQRPLTLVHLCEDDGYRADPRTLRGTTAADVRSEVEWNRFNREREQAEEKFWASLEVGQIVHYHNCGKSFIRCEVVLAGEPRPDDANHLLEGDKCLRVVALVGGWSEYDLQPGAYHVRGVDEGHLFLPNATCVWDFEGAPVREQENDPAGMPVCYEKSA